MGTRVGGQRVQFPLPQVYHKAGICLANSIFFPIFHICRLRFKTPRAGGFIPPEQARRLTKSVFRGLGLRPRFGIRKNKVVQPARGSGRAASFFPLD